MLVARVVEGMVVVVVLVGCASKTSGTAAPVPCVADELESNETFLTRKSVGTVQDDAQVGGGADQPSSSLTKSGLSLHSTADVDWYDVTVLDKGISGNPAIRVMTSENTEATAWWTCGQGKTSSVCNLGTEVINDPDLGDRGCLTQPGSSGAPPQLTMQIDCDGTSTDSGTLHIRVKRTAGGDACVPYKLIVSAD